jgi:Zn-dependent protease
MLISEPPPTQADLHFRLLGFPIRVHPFFWLVVVFLGVGTGKNETDPVELITWVAVVFVSIVVHELGHAIMQRTYGGHPWITLYSFGGLASCDDCDRSTRSQVIISFAGPLAGFIFAFVVLLTVQLTGHDFGFGSLQHILQTNQTRDVLPIPLVGRYFAYFEPYASNVLNLIVWQLIYVNIIWGLVNLLPVYPLDGGRISRELFVHRNPSAGIAQSLLLSFVVALALAGYFALRQEFYTCLMFGYFAYANYQNLKMYRSYWR